MKQKNHSGAKKRVKVRKSGTASVEKSAKRHLLSNKSSKAKKANPFGMPVHKTRLKSVKRLLAGLIKKS